MCAQRVSSEAAEHSASEGRVVPTSTKLYFGVGGAAEGAINWAFAAMAFLIYTVIFGVPGTLAGLATAIPIVVDGISDPLIGHLSDRWRSRLGRRHPFIYFASVPLGLATFCVFYPPTSLLEPSAETIILLGYEATSNQWLLALWLLVMSSLLKLFLTCYSLPHLALGAELSDNYLERTRIFRYNTFASFSGGAVLSLFFYFLLIPEGAKFGIDTSWFAGSLAVLSAIAIFLAAHFTRDQIPYLPQAPQNQPPYSFTNFLKESSSVFKNRNYRMLFFGLLFLSAMLGIRETLSAHMGLYFWELEPRLLGMFPFVAISAYIVSMSSVAYLNNRFEKGGTMALTICVAVFAAAFPILARIAGIFPENNTWQLFAVLCLFVALFYGSASILNATVYSAIGDVTDEHELETGARQAGAFYAVRTLFAKVSIAFGHLFAGIAVDVIDFPSNPVAGQIDQQVLFELGLFEGVLATIPAYIAIYFYSRYGIDRRRHAEIQSLLKTRRASS